MLVTVWVIFFYLVYDIGTSFNNGNLLYRTMTDDVNERAKLVIGPRVWVMIIGMLGSAMMMIIVAINSFTGSYKKSYAVVAAAASLIAALISVIGWFMVKEKHVVQQDEEEKVRTQRLLRTVQGQQGHGRSLCEVHLFRIYLDTVVRNADLLCEVGILYGSVHRTG